MDYSSECAIHASKSEWWWVVNPTILLRRDQVVNQVVNRRLTLKWTWMHPGIQEPRERTKWWRDNPYLQIVPADINHSKFYLWIVPANEGSKERRTCSYPVGTATKGIACWYYYVWLLLSPDISWPPLPPSIISLVRWNPSMDKLLFQRLFVIVGIAPLNSRIHPPSTSA